MAGVTLEPLPIAIDPRLSCLVDWWRESVLPRLARCRSRWIWLLEYAFHYEIYADDAQLDSASYSYASGDHHFRAISEYPLAVTKAWTVM